MNRIAQYPSQSGTPDDWEQWAAEQAAELNRNDDGRSEASRANEIN